MTHVYLLTSPQLPGHFKIGVSNNVFRRMGEISDQLAQEMRCDVTINREISLPMALPYAAEAWLHTKFHALRAKVPYHAGHTEWFRARNFFGVVIWLFVLFYLGKELSVARIGIAAIIYYLPYPVDGFVFLFGAFVAQFVFLAGAVGVVLYGFSYLI